VSTGSIYNLSSHTAYNNEYDINTIPPTSLLFDISSRPPSPKRERERERERARRIQVQVNSKGMKYLRIKTIPVEKE
jgi:hypothetical protein